MRSLATNHVLAPRMGFFGLNAEARRHYGDDARRPTWRRRRFYGARIAARERADDWRMGPNRNAAVPHSGPWRRHSMSEWQTGSGSPTQDCYRE
jgi:hypothetical protein